MKKSLLFAVLYSVIGLLCPTLIQAQDIHVNCATVNPCTLTPSGGIAWSQQNPTWIFTPLNPATSILVYLHNRNTTSAHTATIKVFQTGFARTTAPTLTSNADLWVQDAVTQNSTASASCNSVAANVPGTPGASGVGTCYIVSMYTAQVAIQLTGTSAQAGSPDTYDLSIVQQSGYISGPQPGADSSAAGSGNVVIAQQQISGDGFTTTGAVFNTGTTAGAASAGLVYPFATNGTTMDRLHTASAANYNNGSTLSLGAILTEKGQRWSVRAAATTGAAVTATRAGGVGIRHVADCVAFSVFATTAPAAASADSGQILDGASIIWSYDFAQPAAVSDTGVTVCGLNLIGTTNTSMSCTMTNATANASHSCSLSGFTVQ